MGIQLGSRHKRRATGGKRSVYRKRRKFLLGRQAAKTKLSEENRVHKIRVRGGNFKLRALRLNSGIFSWGSEGLSRKTRIIEVVYNGANNEFVRTNTLVKGEIVLIDATPFRMWYESYYGAGLGRKLPAPVKKATKKVKKATSAKPKKAAGEGKPEEKAQGEKKEDKPTAKAGKKAAAKPAAKEGAKAGKKVAAKPAAKAAKAGKAAKPAAKAGKKAAAKPAAKEGAKAEGEKVEKKEGEAEPAAKAAAKAGAKVAAKPAAKAAKAGAKVAAKSAGKSAAKSTGKAGAKGKKIATKKKPIIKPVVKSARVLRKYKARAQKRAVEPILEEHFGSGRVLACISSRPGQTGRVDGYILEGKELEFYIKKTQKKKSK